MHAFIVDLIKKDEVNCFLLNNLKDTIKDLSIDTEYRYCWFTIEIDKKSVNLSYCPFDVEVFEDEKEGKINAHYIKGFAHLHLSINGSWLVGAVFYF